MIRKALLLTVGTGTGADVNIVKPLIKTIRDTAPQFIGFVVSKASRSYAEEIANQLQLDKDHYEIFELTNPENLDSIYPQINSWIRRIVQRGYRPDEITVDFTSGTKAMTSGIVLSGVAWRCGGLKYITGKRKDGVVINGTERFVTVQPETILVHREIQIGRRLLEELRFRSALWVFSSINEALLDSYDVELLEGWKTVAHAYDCWDRFVYNRAAGYLSKISQYPEDLRDFRVAKEIPYRLIQIHRSLEQEEITEDLLADLLNNAERRISEGKFDDAVSRLYRLAEMAAQMILIRDYRIYTGDISIKRLPAAFGEDLERYRDPRDGKIKIGLRQAYEILKILGNPMGDRFLQRKKLQGLIKTRNESFLAHGTKPIEAQAARSFFKEIRGLMEESFPGFIRRCEELRFPWRASSEL